MPRLSAVLHGHANINAVSYYCPGCRHAHTLPYGDGPSPRWTWNGDELTPTFGPSIRTSRPAGPYGDNDEQVPELTLCHHFVVAGIIQFLDDSSAHSLRGFHPMVPIPDNYSMGD